MDLDLRILIQQTLAQAANRERNCLFVCRTSTAPAIWETLTDPPYCTTYGIEGVSDSTITATCGLTAT